MKETKNPLLVYGGTGHHSFDANVLRILNSILGVELKFSHLWYHTWPDSEPGFRIEKPEKIKGNPVLVFSCPVTGKLNDELRDILTAVKHQYFASRVFLVLSFLRFRRQDHPEIDHEITRLRWFIRDLKHYGADELFLIDPHSIAHTQKFCDEFGLILHICDPTRLFADNARNLVNALGGRDEFRIYAPDGGSVPRAIALWGELRISIVATPKRRINGEITMVESEGFLKWIQEKYGLEIPISCNINDVADKHVIMVEDEIDTATTAVMTTNELRRTGAKSVRFIATHSVCSSGWKMKLFPYGAKPPFDTIWLGNARPRGINETEYEGSTGGRIEDVSIEPIVAGKLAQILGPLLV